MYETNFSVCCQISYTLGSKSPNILRVGSIGTSSDMVKIPLNEPDSDFNTLSWRNRPRLLKKVTLERGTAHSPSAMPCPHSRGYAKPNVHRMDR